MLRNKLLFISVLYCSAVTAQTGPDSPEALQWLQTNLKRYFEDRASMQQLTTTRYAAYKTNAMNVGFYSGMTKSAFLRKWGHIYNTRQPHLQEAFLVPLQDWNHITLTCEPLPARDHSLWVGVGIKEEPSMECFRIDVKLVQQNDSWRIDDVLEVVPLHESVTGDFNGDKERDTLYASLTGRISQTPVLVDTFWDRDTLIARVVRQEPQLELAARGFPTLRLNEGNHYILGLYYLANIGNINKTPGDEIAVVIDAADWSNNNLYLVYTYGPHGWQLIRQTEIREENLPAIRSGRLKPVKF